MAQEEGQTFRLDSRDGLRRAILEERQRRMALCAEELQALMEKHDCYLVALPRIDDDGRIVADVAVKPNEIDPSAQ